jgi:flagellin
MDTDFAKAQSESVRLQILQQTATSSLAQANNGPQSVLGFIGG